MNRSTTIVEKERVAKNNLFYNICELENIFQELHPKEIQLFLKINNKKLQVPCPTYLPSEFTSYFSQLYEELLKDPDYKKYHDMVISDINPGYHDSIPDTEDYQRLARSYQRD